nr:PREDICTED: fanconi-associated nuclease 1-like [Bemisia tabaci]
MSQDYVEIIAEGVNPTTRNKSGIKQRKSSTITLTPKKIYDIDQVNPKQSLSQDIARRPGKFISSPTKSPWKKTSSALTKYSPFRKNSPAFKNKPITFYFQQSRTKSSVNPLTQVLQSIKEDEKLPSPDKEAFESLLSDDFDLTEVEIDADVLSPPKKVTILKEPMESTSYARDSSAFSPDDPEENHSTGANSPPEEDDEIFKRKRIKKKIKKTLFPSAKPDENFDNVSGSVSGESFSMKDSQFIDTAHTSKSKLSQINDISIELLSSPFYKSSQEFELQNQKLSQDSKDSNLVFSPQKPSDESYTYVDSYSSCIEAALTDCLTFLKKNKENGIFVDLIELEKFTANGSLHQTRRRLYARLLINRQYKWYRLQDLKSYEAALNISNEELVSEIIKLEEEGFLTSNLNSLDLPSMLNLLQVKDLKSLCKIIRVSDNKSKPELIKLLVDYERKQPILRFFSKTSQQQSSKTSILIQQTKKLLGHCIKLTDGPRNAFFQCLLFATYPFFSGDPQTRLKDYLDRLVKVQKNEISFPSYVVHKTVVFSFERSFSMYHEALKINENVFIALNRNKKDINWTKVAEYANISFNKFEEILKDVEINNYVETLPAFLRRFTAGHVYARNLFSVINENKKGTDKNFIVKALNLLIDQKLYAFHKRGTFYEELAMTYQNYLKDTEKALCIVLQGLKDPEIDLPMKYTLSIRGSTLVRRKTKPVSQGFKAEVEKYLFDIPTPTSVIINARCLEGQAGYKQIYVTETDDGVEFSSVEEIAKSYYRKLGFTQVLHDEGGTVRAVAFACFWDIIYLQPLTVVKHSVFHSPFQSHPLDWGFQDFFQHRRPEILARLEEMEEGGVEVVMQLLTRVCEESENIESVINWNYLSKTRLNLLKDFLASLSVKVFCKLCLHLLQNVRLYGKAFPDLTMWNPFQKKCMFVEVKSPKDRLSHNQRLWLYNLSKMGANSEVCNIQATGSRKRKLVIGASTPSIT